MLASPNGFADLASSLASNIQSRAHHQVRDLRVALDADRIVIEGRVRTQHAKQLAHDGALNCLRDGVLVNRIVVG